VGGRRRERVVGRQHREWLVATRRSDVPNARRGRGSQWRDRPGSDRALETGRGLPVAAEPSAVPPRVERPEPEGVDHAWVMQVTFVLTIVVGAPVVAGLSLLVELPTWASRLSFAVRVGAVVWLVTAVAVYLYARRYRVERVGAG